MLKIEPKKVRDSLSGYVRKISVFSSQGSLKSKHRLIPCGCTYLSYNHKDIPSFVNSKKVDPAQRLQITGPKIDNNIHVEYDGKLSQILIEFTPTGFYYLLHDSPGNYLNKLLNLSDFIPQKSVYNLSIQLHSTDDPDNHSEFIQEFLVEQSFQALPFCQYVEDAIEIIHTKMGKIMVKDIANSINKSERQFNRQFLKMVGISPKVYSKLVQLHYVINLMNLKEYSSIKEISYSAHFYDQSHFDRRFKELVGLTPSEFLVSKEHNALKYFTDLVKAGISNTQLNL
jgi:AraC-like DNA-binding protein